MPSLLIESTDSMIILLKYHDIDPFLIIIEYSHADPNNYSLAHAYHYCSASLHCCDIIHACLPLTIIIIVLFVQVLHA